MYHLVFKETIVQHQVWGSLQPLYAYSGRPTGQGDINANWDGILIPITLHGPSPSMMITYLAQITAVPLVGQWQGSFESLPAAQAILSDCIHAGLTGVMDPYGHITNVGNGGGFKEHMAHHMVQLFLDKDPIHRAKWVQYWMPNMGALVSSWQAVATHWVKELPMQLLVIGPHRPPLVSMTSLFPNINIIFKDSVSKAMEHLFQTPIDMVFVSSRPYDLWAHHAAHLIHDFFPKAHLVLLDEAPCPELLIEFFCNGGRGYVSPHDWCPVGMTFIMAYGLLQWVSRYAPSMTPMLELETFSRSPSQIMRGSPPI